MRCARLAAPFVTALCIFDTLRGGSAARRSYIMVSSRASSSPMPQPASRHGIKPFSIQPIIANIRHSAVSTSQYRFAIWGRRCAEWPFAFFAAGRAACPHAAAARWDTAPYRIRYRTRGERGRQLQCKPSHIQRITSANPIPKGGEAFRGL